MTTSRSHKDMAIDAANKRKYARKYYRAHKPQARKYSLDNREKIRLRAAQWRKDNRERYLEQQAAYDLLKRARLTTAERIEKEVRRLKRQRSDPKE